MRILPHEADVNTDAFELLEHLQARYPKQFSKLDPIDYSCPVGWFSLVREVCELDEALGSDVKWGCIKEKLGRLQMIMTPPWTKDAAYEQVQVARQRAFELSLRTCALCGGSIDATVETPQSIDGWLISLCRPCEPAVRAFRAARFEETLNLVLKPPKLH